MLRRKVHVESYGSGSDSRSGPTVLFTTTLAPATQLGERTVPASTSPTVQPQNQLVNAWRVRATDRKGEVQGAGFTLYRDLPERRERPDGTKERPFDVGSSPANQPLLAEEGDV